MKIFNQKLGVVTLLTILAPAGSLLMTAIYATNYVATLEKRITVLEKHDDEIQLRISDIRESLFKTNDAQDQDQEHFQQTTIQALNHLDDKIEKIYAILINAKKYKGQYVRAKTCFANDLFA
jgi:peptidoglycan hydrolase CwlO-like protein